MSKLKFLDTELLIYRKIILYVIIFFFMACSDNDSNINPDKSAVKIIGLNPQRAKINDTLTIKGINLNKISRVSFNGKYVEKFIYQDSGLIKVIIPVLNYEKVKVKILYEEYKYEGLVLKDSDEARMELFGVFPIIYDFDYNDINHIQILNDSTYFISAGRYLYKSLNGGYDWQFLHQFQELFAFYFFSTQEGWLSVIDDIGHNVILYTSDMVNFESKFDLGSIPQGDEIFKIEFSDSKNGYFISREGQIFKIDDKDISLLYTYPDPDNATFVDLTVLDSNHLWASGNCGYYGNIPTIIKIEDNQFSLMEFDPGYLSKIQFLDNNLGFLILNGKLLKSIDSGLNWINTDVDMFNFYFWNNQNGLCIEKKQSCNCDIFRITSDGGKSWTYNLTSGNYENTLFIKIKNGIGLIGGYRDRIWKYIQE